MPAHDVQSYYYSGQGVVLIGERDTTTGKPKGLVPVGNVSALRIAVQTAVLEHKESFTGNRSVDLRLTTETKCALAVTLESFDSRNLAMALRGTRTVQKPGNSGTEAISIYYGKVTPLKYANITSVTSVKAGTGGSAVTLTAYTNDTTPWDYKFNTAAGSISFNDGELITAPNLASSANAGATALATPYVTAGATTTLTFAATPTGAVAGGYIMVQGCTGADAALLNGKAHEIYSTTSTTVVLTTNTAAKTIVGSSAFAAPDGLAGETVYAYGLNYHVGALTSAGTDRYLRFEGLNTADNNNPVVVEVFKFSVDPLKELALVGEGIGQFVLEGNVLSDSLQTTGSKYFKQFMVR